MKFKLRLHLNNICYLLILTKIYKLDNTIIKNGGQINISHIAWECVKCYNTYMQDIWKCLWKFNTLWKNNSNSVGIIGHICKMTYYHTINCIIAHNSKNKKQLEVLSVGDWLNALCYNPAIKYYIAIREWCYTLCINTKTLLSKTHQVNKR